MISDQIRPSQILGGDCKLYLGGKVDAKAKNMLQSLGIKYILNCTPPRAMDPETGCPNFFEKERSFVYRRIPVFDNRGAVQYIAKFSHFFLFSHRCIQPMLCISLFGSSLV